MTAWYVVRTDQDALIFRPSAQALALALGSEIVTLHDHDDGTACALVRGGLADRLLSEGLPLLPATQEQLAEAGFT